MVHTKFVENRSKNYFSNNLHTIFAYLQAQLRGITHNCIKLTSITNFTVTGGVVVVGYTWLFSGSGSSSPGSLACRTGSLSLENTFVRNVIREAKSSLIREKSCLNKISRLLIRGLFRNLSMGGLIFFKWG